MRKQPLRKCVVTQEQYLKKELIRVVKNKEGQIFVDVTGKQNGRGAYLKKSREVIDLAQKRKTLDRVLETSIPDTIYEELRNYVE